MHERVRTVRITVVSRAYTYTYSYTPRLRAGTIQIRYTRTIRTCVYMHGVGGEMGGHIIYRRTEEIHTQTRRMCGAHTLRTLRHGLSSSSVVHYSPHFASGFPGVARRGYMGGGGKRLTGCYCCAPEIQEALTVRCMRAMHVMHGTSCICCAKIHFYST